MDVEFTSYRTDVLLAFEKAKLRALVRIGMRAERHAKEYVPVQTGRLRSSISNALNGDDAVAIGTNVEYAPYVELGTSRQKPHPYLKPAVALHVDEYKKIAMDEFMNA